MTGAAASAGALKKPSSLTFTTGAYSTLGLQQILTQLGYLPFTWTPSATGSDGSIPADAPAAAGSGTTGSTPPA